MEDKLINTIEVAGATVCASTLLLDRERKKGRLYVTMGRLFLTLLTVQGRELMGFHNKAGFMGVMQVGKNALKYP